MKKQASRNLPPISHSKRCASTKDFNFEAAGFKIPGRGELDLGNRTLSLSMFPESDDKSVGINGSLLLSKYQAAGTNVCRLGSGMVAAKTDSGIAERSSRSDRKELGLAIHQVIFLAVAKKPIRPVVRF